MLGFPFKLDGLFALCFDLAPELDDTSIISGDADDDDEYDVAVLLPLPLAKFTEINWQFSLTEIADDNVELTPAELISVMLVFAAALLV